MSILAAQRDRIPPTINFSEPDPRCDLDYTFNEPVERTVRVAMSNAFGFGGHNTTVLFEKFEAWDPAGPISTKHDLVDDGAAELVVQPLAPLPPLEVELVPPRRRPDLDEERPVLHPGAGRDVVDLRPREVGPRLDRAHGVDLVAVAEAVDEVAQERAEGLGLVREGHGGGEADRGKIALAIGEV